MASRTKTTVKKRTVTRPERSASVLVVDEQENEAGGAGWETAVAVVTGVVLLIAIILTDIHLGRYGSGLFS